MRSSVVLPEPEVPTMTVIVRGAIVMVTASTTVFSP